VAGAARQALPVRFMQSVRGPRLRGVSIWLTVVAVSACRGPSVELGTPVVESTTVTQNGELALPNVLTSVKFAVIGDSGRGSREQHQVAEQMARFRDAFKFAFVLMLGDNIYEGPASPDDYRRKFEEPYRALLADRVRFFAVLGNHDDPRQVSYEPFHMEGQRYYSFAPPEDPLTRLTTRVEFFALDSTNLDRGQLDWASERLAASRADWKVVFLHHPLYTSGRYRQTSRLQRWALESMLVRHDVDVVFSGHEHIYQRTQPQRGVLYFVSGGAGSLRRGDGLPAPFIARSYDDDYHFMLVEIESDALHFQAISRTGRTVDAGTLFRDADAAGRRREAATPAGSEGRP
jgi:3',5'-cyclic AMP phosphodiesterase CpdA